MSFFSRLQLGYKKKRTIAALGRGETSLIYVDTSERVTVKVDQDSTRVLPNGRL